MIDDRGGGEHRVLPDAGTALMSGGRCPIDLSKLERWMDEHRLGSGSISDVERVSGGTQNLLLRFSRDGRSYLLRSPPPSAYRKGSDTIAREVRILRALAGSDVPHAALIGDCPDEAVLGAAFYLMEPIEGFCATLGLPALHETDPKIRHEMGLSVIDGLARLHNVDHEAVGLGDFGHPTGFLERQVPRWLKQLDSYHSFAGWDGRDDIPGVEKIANWLTHNIPQASPSGILHGDFHLGNVLFSNSSATMAAIVDWELATIGDPLLDLGCLLATWTDPDGSHPGCIAVQPWSGFPTEEELVRRYGELSGRNVDAINWYVVLGCFKLGLIQEGTYARAKAGKADIKAGEWLHRTTINLFHRALTRI